MNVAITVDGADEAVRALQAAGDRVAKNHGPLLEAVGQQMVTWFEANIREEGQRTDSGWPDLHPVTRAIRAHYGHTGGKLVRSGDLLHSIRVLELGQSFVEVGTGQEGKGGLPAARLLQDGGTVTDERGTREVQAFPFIVLKEQDVADILEMVALYAAGAL